LNNLYFDDSLQLAREWWWWFHFQFESYLLNETILIIIIIVLYSVQEEGENYYVWWCCRYCCCCVIHSPKNYSSVYFFSLLFFQFGNCLTLFPTCISWVNSFLFFESDYYSITLKIWWMMKVLWDGDEGRDDLLDREW
jgi:hypothetical protein